MFVVCWGSVAVGFVDWLVMVVRRSLGWLRWAWWSWFLL